MPLPVHHGCSNIYLGLPTLVRRGMNHQGPRAGNWRESRRPGTQVLSNGDDIVKKKLLVVVAAFICAVCVPTFSQERETASVDTLVAVLTSSTELSKNAAAVRLRLDEGYPARSFVEDIAKLQRQFEPAITSIAQTNAPPDAQRFAMQVAMGTKEVELALWYYIYAVLSNDKGYLQNGDALLKRGINQLGEARALLESR